MTTRLLLMAVCFVIGYTACYNRLHSKYEFKEDEFVAQRKIKQRKSLRDFLRRFL